MFGNFLYVIVVLLIYATYPSSENTNFPGYETLALFLGLILLFTFATWLSFFRLQDRIAKAPLSRLDHRFNTLVTRHSAMAVALFAIDVYGLNLPSFLSDIPLFARIPTVQALLFLGLFIFYLSVVWAFSHDLQHRIYGTDQSRTSYILSNISISVPILIPWLVLSGLSDVINALPFSSPKQWLLSTEGQMVYFLFSLFGIAILGPAMIQKFWQCKPLEDGFYRDRIEGVCNAAGLAYSDILRWPIFGGQMITAGVMGLIKKFRYILVTDGLLRHLAPEEIDAVIAHEIGHVKHRHLLFYLFFFLGYMLLSYATFDLVIYAIVYSEPIYRFINAAGFDPENATSALFSLVTILIFLVYFRYIFGFFMRNFERQADTYVYTLFESAAPLISTLHKIALTSGQPPDKPNWHHFSIRERVDYLKKCETDKRWITHHNRRIRRSMAVYLVGLLSIAGIGYSVNFGGTGEKLAANHFERVLLRAIDRTPDNPNLYSMLGDLHYNRKEYGRTIQAYTRSLTLSANNPHALNNLAWLYATCEHREFRDPGKAVRLAEKAAHLIREPHILDTLAESYYANGNMDRAITVARKTLELAKKNRSYYREQLEKFINAKNKIDMLNTGVAI